MHDLDVSPELLQKYDRPGPRYTSYPTAPEWSEEFGPADYAAALDRAALQTHAPLSVYVHIPFCEHRCLFCGCNVIISKRHEISGEYLRHLYREIGMVSGRIAQRRTVRQLHLGGGTPTYLDVRQLRELHGVLAEHFSIAPEAEVAIEVDPRVTTKEQLDTLRALGFNRISLGVQDLDEKVQAAITRNQTAAQTRWLVDESRALGFGGVNIDLIYGLPEQTRETWEATIRETIRIRPDRLAVYSYAHLPDRLKHQKKIDMLPRPIGPQKYALFATARRLFLEAGYRAIGLDHFALPEDELSVALDAKRLHRNFMGYSVVPSGDQLGFGVSAIGEVGGVYAQNFKRPVQYDRAIEEGGYATMCGIRLSADDDMRRWAIRQLMCNFQLEFAELRARYEVEYGDYFAEEEEALAPFYAEGFLTREPQGLRVLPLGQVFIRNICMVFDAYLKRAGHAAGFSRTV